MKMFHRPIDIEFMWAYFVFIHIIVAELIQDDIEINKLSSYQRSSERLGAWHEQVGCQRIKTVFQYFMLSHEEHFIPTVEIKLKNM